MSELGRIQSKASKPSNSKVVAFVALVLALLIPVGTLLLQGKNSFSKDFPSGKDICSDLTIPVPCYPECFDPQQVVNANDKSLLLLNYSRLVKTTESLSFEPELAESWTYDIDSRKLQFNIRPGVLFQDGIALKVDDVIFSIHEWAKANSLDGELLLPISGVAEYRAGKIKTISGIHKINENQFSITLTWHSQNQNQGGLRPPAVNLEYRA